MSASQFISSQVTDEDLRFPTSEDLVNYTSEIASEITPIVARVPVDLITEKLISSCKLNTMITFQEDGSLKSCH